MSIPPDERRVPHLFMVFANRWDSTHSNAVDQNNRFVGMCYDGAGNLTSSNGQTMTYDAEGMITAYADTQGH